jgi:hypothetical protein
MEQAEFLTNVLRLVADASSKTPSTTVFDFVRQECLKLPAPLVVTALREFAALGVWPTVSQIQKRIGLVIASEKTDSNPCTIKSELKPGTFGIVDCEMPLDSDEASADAFFAAKVLHLQSIGYVVGRRRRFKGDAVVNEVVKGREIQSKRQRIKEQIEVTRPA